MIPPRHITSTAEVITLTIPVGERIGSTEGDAVKTIHLWRAPMLCPQPVRAAASLLLAAGLSISQVPDALALTPSEALKNTRDKVVRLLNNPELKQPERQTERRQQLVDIVSERFSYEEMSRRVLGDQWTKLNETERVQFVQVFRHMLAKSYATNIEGYGREPLQYLGERLVDGCAEVRTRIHSAKHEIQVDFRLIERIGDWFVYDVIVDGVSLVTSYRGQMARILRRSSYEYLLDLLRKKAALPMHAYAD